MQRIYTAILCALAFTVIVSRPTYAQNNREPRARDLGVPFDGTPGPLNVLSLARVQSERALPPSCLAESKARVAPSRGISPVMEMAI